ncbi:MAG: HEAT repeat domain-containing protein [Bacteroides sp.]|nr:HEAT repeat domain-containing protein [Bacteroides sp.]
MKNILLATLLLSAASLQAQEVIAPAQKVAKTSFAVITDSETWKQCGNEIKDYTAVLAEEGLPSFIVHHTWQRPEEVKEVIKRLYKKNKLEGVVFIGDIPIAMLRKAQHFTTAFKMDETIDWHESSVPSDRFYDDLDLEFDYLKQDSLHPECFYYNLAVHSPQTIKCDIYSGRVKPLKNGTDPYEQVKLFLRKTIAEHKSGNQLDQFFSHTGEGSYSNSLTAWAPEEFTLREQMPGLFDGRGRARFLRYNFLDYPKDDIINMLKRDDLDLTIIHAHGLPHRQYISADPETHDAEAHIERMKYAERQNLRRLERRGKNSEEIQKEIAKLESKYFVDKNWADGWNDPEVRAKDSIYDLKMGILLDDVTAFKPNSRMLIFDACYNGDFREDDYISGRYIFSEGKSCAVFANSVNVLQDKQANEMLGTLALGARIGHWARMTNILESHITGDPTLRFVSNDPEVDASELCRKFDKKKALAALDSPYADIQNIAMHQLFYLDHKGISDLLRQKFENSPYTVVRYTALSLLEKLSDDNFKQMLIPALTDQNEFIRRYAVRQMSHVGLSEYVPHLVNAYIQDNLSQRVAFNITIYLPVFDKAAVDKAIDEAFAKTHLVEDKEARRQELLKASAKRESYQEIFDKTSKWRKSYISGMRNTMMHCLMDDLLPILKDNSENEEVRLKLFDALAWFRESYRRDDIMQACQSVMKDKQASQAVKEAAERTYYRLKI